MGLDGMGYHLREFALWILPSSWLSRMDPGSERMPFTLITGQAGQGTVADRTSNSEPPNRGPTIGELHVKKSPILSCDFAPQIVVPL